MIKYLLFIIISFYTPLASAANSTDSAPDSVIDPRRVEAIHISDHFCGKKIITNLSKNGTLEISPDPNEIAHCYTVDHASLEQQLGGVFFSAKQQNVYVVWNRASIPQTSDETRLLAYLKLFKLWSHTLPENQTVAQEEPNEGEASANESATPTANATTQVAANNDPASNLLHQAANKALPQASLLNDPTQTLTNQATSRVIQSTPSLGGKAGGLLNGIFGR